MSADKIEYVIHFLNLLVRDCIQQSLDVTHQVSNLLY